MTALGNDVLEVLSAAAVLGTEFAEDAVIAMVDIPEREAMDALDLAERARLVVDVGPQAAAMRFVHALVAGTVYSELPGRRRRRLHARAAQVLEQRSGAPATDLAVELARHCALGGLPAEALRWARLRPATMPPTACPRPKRPGGTGQPSSTLPSWRLPITNAPTCSPGWGGPSTRSTIRRHWRR